MQQEETPYEEEAISPKEYFENKMRLQELGGNDLSIKSQKE